MGLRATDSRRQAYMDQGRGGAMKVEDEMIRKLNDYVFCYADLAFF